MTTRREIVETAREELGTRFHHVGRLPGVALDCVGLAIATAHKLGLDYHDIDSYPRIPDGKTLTEELAKCTEPVGIEDVQPGDMIVFWCDPRTKHPQHLGIVTQVDPIRIIHTWEQARRVCETDLGFWAGRICYARRYKGIEG